MQIHPAICFAVCCQLCLFQTSLSWFTPTSVYTQAPNLNSVTVSSFLSHLITAISRRESRNQTPTFWAQNHNRPFPMTFCIVEKGVRNQKGLPGPAGLCWPSLCKPRCSSGSWDCASWLQLSLLLLSSRADLFWAMQRIPEASQHAHPQAVLSCCPQPSTSRLLLTAIRVPHASGKFFMYKTTGSKRLVSRIFLIIF